ncbi:MAG: type I-G CRISPR-associated protein Csb2 [Isosphaeraceae bacterium]
MDALCITIRFLQPMCHGRDEFGEPEWPPSPLRLFQALVEAAAARWNERARLETAAPVLRWLERQPPPVIVAALGEPSTVKYRLYVPDNVGDKVAGSWSRGGAADIAEYRTEKDVRPTRLPAGGEAVYYVWNMADHGAEFQQFQDVLGDATRSITHLGWGVDMVVADAATMSRAEVDRLPGERWYPTRDGSSQSSRAPLAGTLDALIAKYESFLNRLGPNNLFSPVPPLSAFQPVGYRRAMDSPSRSFVAFSLLRPDAGGFQPFGTLRYCLRLAAMTRHAAAAPEIARALGWSSEKVAQFVLGHGEAPGEAPAPVAGPRLAFLPLPSIERRGNGPPSVVTSIRRALITVVGGSADQDLNRLARLLSGMDLMPEDDRTPAAMLSLIPGSDSVVKLYTGPASTWATVTPVILPGHDDPKKLRRRLFPGPEATPQTTDPQTRKDLLARLDRRIEHLLRKAIVQAGYSRELADRAEIEWRTVGFWPGTEPATSYPFPNKLRRHRRVHVRITWRDSTGRPMDIPGPICLGGGRFHGLGLLAARR